jgi:hypothetical protein
MVSTRKSWSSLTVATCGMSARRTISRSGHRSGIRPARAPTTRARMADTALAEQTGVPAVVDGGRLLPCGLGHVNFAYLWVRTQL